MSSDEEKNSSGDDTDTGSIDFEDDDDSSDFGIDSGDDSDIPDPRDTPSKRLTQHKSSVQSRIKSAKNWFIFNIIFFVIFIAIFSILYSLGYLSFDTGFNSSAN